MTAVSSTFVSEFRCEVRKCANTHRLAKPELSTDPRWHAPTSPSYYEAGWVFKLGHASALHYCPQHAARAYRCTCPRRGGELYGTKDSCAQHSDIADIRTRLAELAYPKRVLDSLNPVLMSRSEWNRQSNRPFTFRGWRWSRVAERTDLGDVRVSWVWEPLS